MNPHSIIIVSLHTPKEKLWGELLSISPAGITIRGIDLNSFDHFVNQINGPDSERTGLPTLFFPMNRVERVALDESPAPSRRFRKSSPVRSAVPSRNISHNLPSGQSCRDSQYFIPAFVAGDFFAPSRTVIHAADDILEFTRCDIPHKLRYPHF